jgi:hypothetical protein
MGKQYIEQMFFCQIAPSQGRQRMNPPASAGKKPAEAGSWSFSEF